MEANAPTKSNLLNERLKSVLPGLGTFPTVAFSQHVGHPLAGEGDVALADLLPELPRHEPHHLFVVLSTTRPPGR